MPARATPGFAECDAGADGDVLERAVAVVAVQPVRLGVVGDEQVHPAVAVEVEHRHAESLRRRVEDAGLARDVLERAVAAVVKERRALALVRLRRAVRLVLAVERAVQVGLDGPLDVVRDEQIELAVVVVVEPQRARREPAVADAGLLRDVRERAAASVPKQPIAAERGDVDDRLAVVVEVGRRRADAVQLDVEPGPARDVGERRRCPVAVQRRQRRRASPRTAGFQALPVDEQDVLPAVGVDVEEQRRRTRSSRAGTSCRRRRCCGRNGCRPTRSTSVNVPPARRPAAMSNSRRQVSSSHASAHRSATAIVRVPVPRRGRVIVLVDRSDARCCRPAISAGTVR